MYLVPTLPNRIDPNSEGGSPEPETKAHLLDRPHHPTLSTAGVTPHTFTGIKHPSIVCVSDKAFQAEMSDEATR